MTTTTPAPTCPKCGKPLQKVTQGPNSMLNSEQFDAARCGDWFCELCPKVVPAKQYSYFWDRDLAATPPATPAPTEQAELPLLPSIPRGDRHKDETLFRHLGRGGSSDLYECWDDAVYKYAQDYAREAVRAALAARQAPDSRNVWTDEQRENHRANKALVYRCPVCCVKSGVPHFPDCSNSDTSGLPG